MPGNSMCRLTDRVRHYLNSVYLAIKRQSNINELLAKTHDIQDLMAGIYYRPLYFFDSWYSKVIEIKLMNYFALASKNLKLERNEAFSAELILYFIRNKGN